jgi:hypothetical protein
MKKYLLIAVFVFAAIMISPTKTNAQYTYFPPISAQSATLHHSIEYARASRRAASLRRSRRSVKMRATKRSRRAHHSSNSRSRSRKR